MPLLSVVFDITLSAELFPKIFNVFEVSVDLTIGREALMSIFSVVANPNHSSLQIQSQKCELFVFSVDLMM
jgi:hypothetical protein